MITIELLRRAGVSDALIAKVAELEQAEQLAEQAERDAEKREQRRLRNRRYREQVRRVETRRDVSQRLKTRDASQRLASVDSAELLGFSEAKNTFAIDKKVSKEEERKKESIANVFFENPANSIARVTDPSVGPANGHCYWTEAGLHSPDGLVTISKDQLASYVQSYPGLRNVEGQIRSALQYFGTEKPPAERVRGLTPWLAKREQDALDKRERDAAKAKERTKREGVRKNDRGAGWSDLA